MTTNDFSKQIYNRFGMVTRARNCFLYTKKGIRLTDMFQENGRAILGWHGGSAFTYFKNYLSKGLTGSFICEDKSRLEKAYSQLLDHSVQTTRTIIAFSTKKEALMAGLMFSPQNTSVYTPWNPENIDYSKVDVAIIQPPLPWTQTIYLTAIKNSVLQTNNIPEDKLVPANAIPVPYAMQAAITRAVYNLIQELPLRQEKDWFLYDTVLTKYWTRKGPYLYPKVPEDQYDSFVAHCLDCQIVINPAYNSPSIIPFGADKGVFTMLKNNPFSF